MHLDTLWYAVALVWLSMLIGTVIFVFTRGTMDEVSPLGRLDLRTATQGPPVRLFHLVLGSHDGRALVPIPKRSASP